MKLIVGLGNPGKEYEGTRHNVGFRVLEAVVSSMEYRVSWGYEKKFEGEMARWGEVLLLKPMTFMNRSGVSIKKVRDFYKIKGEDIWVIHDDLDIRLGEFKIQKGKGPKDHKGVLSVERELGTKDFWRVRVGVENRRERSIPGEKYVLMRFSEEEQRVLDEVVDEVMEKLEFRI